MTGYLFEFIVIFFLIFLNALFSLSELAIVSSRKAKLQQLANEGKKNAKIALDLAESPEDFLSTVQVGITSIGILAGVFGGATIAEGIAGELMKMPLISVYAEPISLVTVVLPITFFSLVIGELVPKRLALNSPEKIACLVAQPMTLVTKFSLPLVKILSNSTKFVLKIIGFKDSEEPAVTEEEIKVLISQGREQGTFHEFEEDMIKRVFRLSDRGVSVLMTPRNEVVWINLNGDEKEIKTLIQTHHYACFPLCEDEIDNIRGIIRTKDFVKIFFETTHQNIKDYLREIASKPQFLSENLPALRALEIFKKNRVHQAVVIDEYGVVQGVITLNDILRSVFEELPENQIVDKKIIKREDGSYLISGSTPLDEFFDEFSIGLERQEEFDGINTIGGFVMHLFAGIPNEGTKISWYDFTIEVIDMDGKRVDKILMSEKK